MYRSAFWLRSTGNKASPAWLPQEVITRLQARPMILATVFPFSAQKIENFSQISRTISCYDILYPDAVQKIRFHFLRTNHAISLQPQLAQRQP